MSIDEKASGIRLALFDVDGILTSGHIFYDTQGNRARAFHVHDGLGLKLLMKAGIEVGVISAKNSIEVETRLKELGVQHIYLGQGNKLPAYEALKKALNVSDQEVSYMGDDLPDIKILAKVGLTFTVPDACDLIKQAVDYISTKKGGEGAVREVCELIIKAQNKYESVVQSYL